MKHNIPHILLGIALFTMWGFLIIRAFYKKSVLMVSNDWGLKFLTEEYERADNPIAYFAALGFYIIGEIYVAMYLGQVLFGYHLMPVWLMPD